MRRLLIRFMFHGEGGHLDWIYIHFRMSVALTFLFIFFNPLL